MSNFTARFAPRSSQAKVGKTCAEPVQTTPQTRGIIVHNIHRVLWERQNRPMLSPIQTPFFTRFRTQIVHSLADNITEVVRHLSAVSTAPIITITT